MEVTNADKVVAIIRGNDLTGRDMDLPQLPRKIHLLGLGLTALGVRRIWLFPILPRLRTRRGDVAPERYEERRQAANRVWETRFRAPPVTMLNVNLPRDLVG